MRGLAVLAVACALVAACGITPRRGEVGREDRTRGRGESLSEEAATREILYGQYREWQGVSYRRGGLSKKGVDCSGFVFLTFRDRFGIILPRKAKDQAAKGTGVARKSLRPGDLVFFKTGLFSRHVGIYVGQRTFLHVSEKKGVTMSNLDSRYWSGKYWRARRVSRG